MNTNVVCSKCGRSEEYSKANREGWLIHQREGQPEGYLIIRCPEHITEHARRQAGLSQRIHTDKIARNIETGLGVEYRQGYKAIAGECESGYQIAYYKTNEEMPAFQIDQFATIEALASEMARLADLRKWRATKTE